MTTPTTDAATRGPALLGQTVIVIGGSSGIGLETARQARAEGAELGLAGLDRGRWSRLPPNSARRKRQPSTPPIRKPSRGSSPACRYLSDT